MNKIIEMTDRILGIFFVPLQSIFFKRKRSIQENNKFQEIYLKCVNI